MKTVFVDTNIILRYLTKDIVEQATRVQLWFETAAEGKIRVVVTHATIIESLFLLEHWYHEKRESAVDKLLLFVSPPWLVIASKDALNEALEIYRTSSTDFVDLLTWTLAKEAEAGVLSFDKHFDRLDPNLRIEP